MTTDLPSDTWNLVLLCSKHHHQVHMKGWHIKRTPDGTLRTSDPPLLC